MRRLSFQFRSRLYGSVGVFVLLCLGGLFWAWHNFFLAHSKFVPDEGGIFTESTIGTLKNLNPLANDVTLFDRDLQQLIFSGLLRYNPVSGQIEGALADFRISEDSRTYFLTLKDSARFQNGDPVTTDDVLFTFEKIIQNPHFDNTILRDAFEYVSLDTVDNRTVSFSLPEQNVFFLSLLTTPVLSAKEYRNALIEEITDPDFPANKNPIGAGPYKLKNIIPSDNGSVRVFLEKNPYFYDGVPYIEQIVFYIYPDFEHLNSDHPWSTMFSKIPFAWLETFVKKLFDTYQLGAEYQKREYLLPRFTALFFNLDQPLTANPNVRKALKLSLEKSKILEKETGWNQIDSFFFFEGIESWHIPDVREATRYLRDGGFPYDSEEEMRMTPNGTPFTLRVVTSTSPPVYSRFTQNIARSWGKNLGIQVDLAVLEPNEFQEALETRNYDVVLFGQNFSQNFDSLSTWHSSQSGKFNLSNLTHEDVDFLIDEVRFSGAGSDLFALNEKLDEIIPAIVLATPKYNLLLSQELHGFSNTFGKVRSHSERFFDANKWYFFEKRDWDWPQGKSKLWGFIKWIFGATPPLPQSGENADT
ncbi:ABC transporter substrate-binding protein [Candidatus Gracilibacteria bacterium]|nr:ABC transporter substrate-binding protein [Candidatus Gracilibacteria bacterium]